MTADQVPHLERKRVVTSGSWSLTDSMETIYYANDTLRTGTDISRAVLAYAGALARRNSSATIDIPVRRDDGTVGRANLLLGPASQLVAEAYTDGADEIIDEDLVADLHTHIKKLSIGTGRPLEEGDVETSHDDYV
jgi:hypothetical protein